MEERKKKNQIRAKFSTIVLCILAILLCAAPCGWAVDYDDGLEYDITTADLDYLSVWSGTTVNLYGSPVANSSIASVYAGLGSILNIYSGNVDWYIAISPDEPYAVVTVYGTNFEVDWDCDGTFVSLDGADELMPRLGTDTTGSVVLKGTYGNGDSIELWFLSDIAIKLKAPDSMVVPMVVEIDIKPGGKHSSKPNSINLKSKHSSKPDSINLKSRKVVPVAVLTTDDFDASTIDPETVLFVGAEPVRWKLCDVDRDGDDDMLFHFKTQDLQKDENNPEGLDEDSTEATLTGATQNGEKIAGTDDVRIVPCKKKKKHSFPGKSIPKHKQSGRGHKDR